MYVPITTHSGKKKEYLKEAIILIFHNPDFQIQTYLEKHKQLSRTSKRRNEYMWYLSHIKEKLLIAPIYK